MMMIFWGPSFIFLIAWILTHMWPNLAYEMARTRGKGSTSKGEVWNAKARNEHLPRPWFPFWKCRVSRRKYSAENLLSEHLPESWFLFALAASSDGNRHSDCVRDVTQVKDWLVGRTGLLKKRHLSDPQACQQDAHQEDPRPPDLWLQGKPHRRGRPHHREGHLQVLEAVAGIFFWQFLFNKLTKKIFVVQRLIFLGLQFHLEPRPAFTRLLSWGTRPTLGMARESRRFLQQFSLQSHHNPITFLIMSQAVHNINNMIAPEIVAKCMDPVEQEKIDQLMVDFASNVKMWVKLTWFLSVGLGRHRQQEQVGSQRHPRCQHGCVQGEHSQTWTLKK